MVDDDSFTNLPSQLTISSHLIADIQKAMFRFRKRITLIQVRDNEMVDYEMVNDEIISFFFFYEFELESCKGIYHMQER